jgi:hypothetical protein
MWTTDETIKRCGWTSTPVGYGPVLGWPVTSPPSTVALCAPGASIAEDNLQMPADETPTRVAIACQGGGSHTAFTAGVLKRLLQSDEIAKYRSSV